MFVLHREESRGCQIRQKWYRLRQPVAVLREPPRRGRRWPPHGVRGPPPAPRWATSLRTAMGYPGCFSPSERSRHDLFDSESARTLTRGPLGAGSSVGVAEGRPCGAAPHPTLGSLASVSPLYAGAPVKTRPRPTVPAPRQLGGISSRRTAPDAWVTPPGGPAASPGGRARVELRPVLSPCARPCARVRRLGVCSPRTTTTPAAHARARGSPRRPPARCPCSASGHLSHSSSSTELLPRSATA